jgi:hypothetical protein
MARGAAALKKLQTPKQKVKKPRGKTVAHIKLGDEPKLMMPSQVQVARALNWYNQTEPSKEQKRDWVLDFMREEGYSADDIKSFNAKYTKLLDTWCFVARMVNNGTIFEDHQLANLREAIRAVIRRHESMFDIDENGNFIRNENVVSIRRSGSSDAKINKLVEFIDDVMDKVLAGDKVDDSVYEELTKQGCNAACARALKEYYKRQVSEFVELARGKDEQLNEGYAHLSKKTRKKIMDFMLQLNADLTQFEKVKKAVRKPRKKRAVKVENVVKRMKFCKASTEYKVASIDPAKIIGADILWTFNTKTRQIGYIESSGGGLNIKGTTIIGGKGELKKMRNPEATLLQFNTGTKANLLSKFKAIKAVPIAHTGRINPHVVLLKVL